MADVNLAEGPSEVRRIDGRRVAVLSANLALQSVRFLGPTLTSTLAATSPLFGVLFGVSLQVREGEVVTLLGRNGMGKSTTVRSIMCTAITS